MDLEEAQRYAEGVLNALSLKDLQLAVAESITGGLASHLLTNIPGCSRNFLGGVVCYTAQSKNMMLDVDWDLINDYGTISPEVTRALLKGLDKLGPDISLAIVGVGGRKIEGKPTGLVYIGIRSHLCDSVHKFNFKGSRIEIKYQAVIRAFELLLDEIEKL